MANLEGGWGGDGSGGSHGRSLEVKGGAEVFHRA